jgi:hypothetical protein
MKRWSLAGAAALGVVAALHGAARQPAEQAAKARGWLTSYEQARAVARQTGKPLLVVFRCQP